MATFDLPVTHRSSLAFHIALNVALFYLGNAIPDTAVHVKVATPKSGDGSLPDQLSLVIQDDSGWETDVVLNRAKYIEPNIPVYTYCGGHKGGSDYQLAELEDNQNVAYYQSADHKAAFQVTKVDSSEHQFEFLLDGELVVNGTRCSLNNDFKRKRDAASSSPLAFDDVVYTLHELPPVPVIDNGFIDLPPKVPKRGGVELPIPGVSGTSGSSPLFSNVKRNSGQDIFIDVVAVVDFARYNKFMSSYGSKDETKKAMREYYLFVINNVDSYYKSATSLPYTIYVRLIGIYADEDSSAPWSTDRALVANTRQVNANVALNNFRAHSYTSAANEFYPNDHIMFFTGYDDVVTFQYGYLQDVWGMAHFSTVCDRGSVSFNKDNNKYQAATTSGHEMAHALSADHDGVGHPCTTGTWLMSIGIISTNFSKCSADAFGNYINKKLQTAEGQKCLWQTLPARNVRSTFSRSQPGREISLNDQ